MIDEIRLSMENTHNNYDKNDFVHNFRVGI